MMGLSNKKHLGKHEKTVGLDNFPKNLRQFYWSVIKKFPFVFGWLFCIIVISYLVDVATFPYVNKWVVEIFQSASEGLWSNKLYWIAAVYAGIVVTENVQKYLYAWARPQINRYLSFVLYRRVYDNDTDFFISRPAGQVMSQMGVVRDKFESMALNFWTSMIKNTMTIVILIAGALAINKWIALVIAVAAVMRGGWRFATQKPINRAIKVLQDTRSAINGVRTDSLANATMVKLFSNVEFENRYIWNRQEAEIQQDYHVAFLRRVQQIPTTLIWFAMLLTVFGLSWYFITRGMMTVADGMFAFTASRSIAGSFGNIMSALSGYSEDRVAAKHAFTEIIQPRSIMDYVGAKNIKQSQGNVEFADVTFNYGKADVIKKFNLDIKHGQKVGVVGLSGAGKTTLVNLLLRAYDVKSGVIKIDGLDIRDITQDSLHKNIAFVPQEAVLFNRTIMENIRYARPSASRADVIVAAKKASIHDFIMSQPDGYETLVGNRGIKLSGGQRQRIAIARAILKDAPILILDEATSALDSKNEVLIQSALQKVMRGKTTIAIAHRLSTLRNMDRIIVLKRGKIVESGTHSELLRLGGNYRKLWDMQTGGFVGE